MTTAPPPRKWQSALKLAVRDPVLLCRTLDLPHYISRQIARAAEQFPVVVPLEYIARMRPGDPHDPLLRQVLPVAAELEQTPGYGTDPVGDTAATLQPGLLQKYTKRVLMVATGTCAVHCRYCFRRQFPYQRAADAADRWQPLLEHLRTDSTVDEVILSGGDPLMLADQKLADLIESLAMIPHIRRVRVHSRLPIVIPQRITRPLISLLASSRLTTIVVVHANHPAELDESVADAIGQLINAGIPVLNQSVLLRGVNDQSASLIELSRRLIDLRVMPYYLHQLDRVQGAAHFEVPVSRGRELVRQMRAALPGYAVPRYVQEQPGAPNKTVLA